MKFFKCKKCGNVVALVEEKGGKLSCCGEEMMELVPRSVDAAVEKQKLSDKVIRFNFIPYVEKQLVS